MRYDDCEPESLERMWQIIEGFGIRRDVYELHKPSYEEVRNLYLIIKEKERSAMNLEETQEC